MDFFYRNKPWYAGQFVRKIIPKFGTNTKLVNFFSTILNKQKGKLLSIKYLYKNRFSVMIRRAAVWTK